MLRYDARTTQTAQDRRLLIASSHLYSLLPLTDLQNELGRSCNLVWGFFPCKYLYKFKTHFYWCSHAFAVIILMVTTLATIISAPVRSSFATRKHVAFFPFQKSKLSKYFRSRTDSSDRPSTFIKILLYFLVVPYFHIIIWSSPPAPM